MKLFRLMLTTIFALFAATVMMASASAEVSYKTVKGTKLKLDVYHPTKHIKGKSKKLKGYFKIVSGSAGNYKLDGAFSVKVRKIKTGNRSRDRVMWSSLGKSRQPYIYFYPKTLVVKGGKGKVTGEFRINKIQKPVTFDVVDFKGTLDGKSAVSLTVKGKLSCDAFKIKRPALLFVKIKDKVDVKVMFKLKPKS